MYNVDNAQSARWCGNPTHRAQNSKTKKSGKYGKRAKVKKCKVEKNDKVQKTTKSKSQCPKTSKSVDKRKSPEKQILENLRILQFFYFCKFVRCVMDLYMPLCFEISLSGQILEIWPDFSNFEELKKQRPQNDKVQILKIWRDLDNVPRFSKSRKILKILGRFSKIWKIFTDLEDFHRFRRFSQIFDRCAGRLLNLNPKP